MHMAYAKTFFVCVNSIFDINTACQLSVYYLYYASSIVSTETQSVALASQAFCTSLVESYVGLMERNRQKLQDSVK